MLTLRLSHHPPTTAYCIVNNPWDVRLQGYNAQKATFSTTIYIKQIGHAVLTMPDPSDRSKKDTYLITLPSLHIEGLIYGTPFIELDGSSYITSSTGFTSRIDYKGKGWLSGKKNTVSAALYKTDKEEVLYSVKGQWTDTLEFYAGPAKKQSKSTLVDTYVAGATLSTPLAVKPFGEQLPLESRRAWAKVAKGIAIGNMELVGVEKGKIENAQRAARAKEKEEGRVWERQYFSSVQKDQKDEVLASLGSLVGLPLDGDADKTGGLWRFDDAKAKVAKANVPGQEELLVVARNLLGQN